MTRDRLPPLLRCMRRLGAALMALALCLPLAAQGRELPLPPPGINVPFANPDVNPRTETFEREGREIWDKRTAIVAALGLGPDMHVADVGAGTGFFVRLMADRVDLRASSMPSTSLALSSRPSSGTPSRRGRPG